MANMKKKMMKNIKGNKEKDKNKYPVKDQITTVTIIAIVMVVIAIVTIIVTNLAKGEYTFGKKNLYNEIIAGQVFNREEKEYYVVFYDNEDIKTTVLGLDTKSKIYLVNLDEAFNKNILSLSTNIKASNIDEFKVYTNTIIKIKDKENVEQVTGDDEIKEYLENIK